MPHALARKLLRADGLHGDERTFLLEHGDVLRLAVGLRHHNYVGQLVVVLHHFEVERHHLVVLDFHLTLHSRLVTYIFYLDVIDAVRQSGQLKIAVNIAHGGYVAAYDMHSRADEGLLRLLVLDASFHVNINIIHAGSHSRRQRQRHHRRRAQKQS